MTSHVLGTYSVMSIHVCYPTFTIALGLFFVSCYIIWPFLLQTDNITENVSTPRVTQYAKGYA